jgi:hypothetical protein
MFDKAEQIFDEVVDDVRPYLDTLATRKDWNDGTKFALAELKKILKKKRYKAFVGHPSRYHLTRIGDSCLYDVPADRRGALSPFRGKRVRLVCVSSGRFDRVLMAGVVSVTPPHLVRSREKPIYVFPDVGDHEIAYLGRRYMLIRSAGETEIQLHQGSFEVVDLEACDYILLDGAKCCPIAIFKCPTDGVLIGTLIGWKFSNEFASIADAVRGMAKLNERFRTVVLR